MPEPTTILKRRKLSGEKLRQARLNAGFDNLSEFCERIQMNRSAYIGWEQGADPVHYDFVLIQNILTVCKVNFEAISDPLTDEEILERHKRRNGKATALPHPAQASA
ncbi:hypothetical protein K7W42_20490 [Deinococcus sp. HMF7604]|uniref:helix-turn-helix domain-containing protein n=1 Tax=Deinococcus betulae TaxID=2873312 RepID=UPI001CCFC1DC|nr:helix-turn-helix domain-containing protein [Deinococcus betulae]MBZ9753219.1 hypothetical protein [Deinococcus betulae]